MHIDTANISSRSDSENIINVPAIGINATGRKNRPVYVEFSQTAYRPAPPCNFSRGVSNPARQLPAQSFLYIIDARGLSELPTCAGHIRNGFDSNWVG